MSPTDPRAPDPSGYGRAALAILLIGWVVPAFSTAAAEPAGPASCEPGAEIEASAAVVSVTSDGPSVTAIVQLTLDPRVDLPRARVLAVSRPLRERHSPARLEGRRLPSETLPERSLSLVADLRRTLLYPVTLPAGGSRDLFFTLLSEESGERIPGASAWVRIGLDPAALPVRQDGLIQYRARAEGR